VAKKKSAKKTAKQTPRNAYERLRELARKACEIFDEQPAPLQDLCEAMAALADAVNRTEQGRPKLPVDVGDLIVTLRGEGLTQAEIAKRLGIGQGSVSRYLGAKPEAE